LDLPELEPYRTLRRPLEHRKQGIFVAEGEKVVRRLLDSGLTIVSMLMTPEWFQQVFEAENWGREDSFDVFLGERKLLESIVGYRLHQGILAVAIVPAESSLQDAIPTFSKPHLLVALDGIVSTENVGVIVRNCAAFGVDGILVGETTSSPYLRRAVRNSMGTIFRLPVFSVSNLVTTLSGLRSEYGTTIVAADPEGQISIYAADFSGNTCIVFGNEGSGLSSSILEVCTIRVAIPMLKEADSLNVANAGAVFLYEARRRRDFTAEPQSTQK